MKALGHILLTTLSLIGLVLIGVPYLQANIAGYFIFLTLCAAPFTLLLLIIEVCLLIWSKSNWRWIIGIIIIGCLKVLTNHLPNRTEIHISNKNKLKLLSWNASNFHLHLDTLQKSATFIRSLNPDIICFQERPNEKLLSWESIKKAFPEYNFSIRNEKREDEVLNLAILSKYPLTIKTETYYNNSYNKTIAVYVTTPTLTFCLHNTHLQTTHHVFTRFIENAQKRNAQADYLKKQINANSIPTLICGDFNDTPCSYVYRNLAKGMQDAFLKATKQWTGSFQPMGRWLRIDYILCSNDWEIQNYELINNSWSDHKMQLVTFSY